MTDNVNQTYIEMKIDPILKPMVIQAMDANPTEPIAFILDFIKKKHGNRQSIHGKERGELEVLRKLVQSMEQDNKGGNTKHDDDSDASQSDSEEEEVHDLPVQQQQPVVTKKARQSVSAEAFGRWNKKEEFKAPVYPKNEETLTALKKRLEQAFMFSALNPKELEIILGAMQSVTKKAGDQVIKEGEDGDNLYVVEKGTLSCTKVFPGNTEPTFLKEYNPGEAFGELALLYNAPRAATIVAKTDAELWALDRRTFGAIVKDSAQKKREQYEEFLKKVPILSNIDAYETNKIADAITEKWFSEGEYVIREGEEGNDFCMVMEGTAQATKTIEPGKPPKPVLDYKTGDYFGERALIKNEPRAANIVATSRLHVVSLERGSFRRLLGPIEEILARNMEVYQQFV